MNRIIVLASVGLLLLFARPAFSLEEACLWEGDFLSGGKKIEIKGCSQFDGIRRPQYTPEDFREFCVSATQGFKPPLKLTRLSACPSPSQASCKVGPVTHHYYKHDAEALSNAKASCQGFARGTWRQ